MKTLFLICVVVLAAASYVTYRLLPDTRSDVPVLYWVTDPNPARDLQIDVFHAWLAKNGYPRFEVRVDTVNVNPEKVIVQGVSGVCGDIIDHSGGPRMRFRHAVGLLADITDDARALGFDTSHTWPAMEPEIAIDGRQYVFPCNIFMTMNWVNRATLRKYGLPDPPERWTFEEFEALGRRFVEAANPPGQPRKVFFTMSAPTDIMYRSLGLSEYNETLSRCILDDERLVRVLKLKHKWTFVDHLIPTEADRASFSTDAGYGGSNMQLFNSGNYAMVTYGRYALIQFRKFGEMDLAVCEPAHGGFPNTHAQTRASGIYRGGKHPELAKYFLAYLASEDYNMTIVRDADGMPPNPSYAKGEAFLHPPAHTNEWGVHEVFARAANGIAIPSPSSPFVLDEVAQRIRNDAESAYLSDLCTAEEAARRMAEQTNAEIERTLRERPALRPLHDELRARQERIDALRREGKPVPMGLISNPFHQRYYVFKGWAGDA